MAETTLYVADISVQQDSEGRFSLNDLHRAAGGEKRHGPSYWLAIEQTKSLVAELSNTEIPVFEMSKGNTGGTFVVRELVYAYAMWISAAFHIKVIRAYDAMVTSGLRSIGGSAPDALTVPGMMALQRQVQRLLTGVLEAKNPAVRRVLYSQLALNLRMEGQPVPTLEDLMAERDPGQPDLPGMRGAA